MLLRLLTSLSFVVLPFLCSTAVGREESAKQCSAFLSSHESDQGDRERNDPDHRNALRDALEDQLRFERMTREQLNRIAQDQQRQLEAGYAVLDLLGRGKKRRGFAWREKFNQAEDLVRRTLRQMPKDEAVVPRPTRAPEGSNGQTPPAATPPMPPTPSTSPTPVPAGRPVVRKVRPRNPGFVVSRRQLRRAIRRRGISNLSLEILISGTRGAVLTEAGARRAAARILATLGEAGQFVRRGDLSSAVAVMADPAVLSGSRFSLSPHRSTIAAAPFAGVTERSYLRHARDRFRFMPSVACVTGVTGVVTIPLVPTTASSAAELRLAQAMWIRDTAEEFAHVAQMLLTRVDPDERFISEMMRSERSVLRSLVALEVEAMNEKAPSFMGFKIPNFYNYEADVYAFLIETFGPEFIPNWFGIESGYKIRRLVDEELTARGVPNREWPEIKE